MLYGIDRNYLPHLSASLESLLTNAGVPLRVIVFASGLGHADAADLERQASSRSVPLEVQHIDETPLIHLKVTDHFSLAMYFRLLAADRIQEERCLYLDADTIVLERLDKLVDVSLDGFYLGGMELPGFNRQAELGMKPSSQYFSSGVMLINLALWRDKDIGTRALLFATRNADAIRWPDQCALNAVVDGRWVEIGMEFNVLTGELKRGILVRPPTHTSPVIVSFGGFKKPWHAGSADPFRSAYWRYRNRTQHRLTVTYRVIFFCRHTWKRSRAVVRTLLVLVWLRLARRRDSLRD